MSQSQRVKTQTVLEETKKRENNFKCYLASEVHLRAMLTLGKVPKKPKEPRHRKCNHEFGVTWKSLNITLKIRKFKHNSNSLNKHVSNNNPS